MATASLLGETAAGVVVLASIGLVGAARRAGFARPRGLAVGVAAGLVLWLGATAALAESGVLAVWSARPPREPLLPMTALATFLLLGRTRSFGRLLAEVPPWQLVAFQAFRAGGEIVFWRLHSGGLAPVQVTFEGRNLDVLVGLTAPLVAAGMAAGRIGPRVAIAWNLSGLAMLLNAIGTTATSVPGPLRLDWPGEPFTALADWPVVWIPALFAPTGIFLHVLSIRQVVARIGEGHRGGFSGEMGRGSQGVATERRVER